MSSQIKAKEKTENLQAVGILIPMASRKKLASKIRSHQLAKLGFVVICQASMQGKLCPMPGASFF